VNPIEKIDRARYDRGEIAILTPEQVRALLFAAHDYTPELSPYLAIAVFAGIRPNELKRLDWAHVNFGLRYIHISSTAAKGRSERYVDMEDVLVAWLAPWRRQSGPVCPQDAHTFTKRFDKARKEAGLKRDWANDVLRHTYASYHVAKYERKDRTALMMGHSVKMLDRHYRKPLHRSHTDEFWCVLPQ
jgi:integrase